MNRRSLYRRVRTPLTVLATASVGAALLVTTVGPARASTSPSAAASKPTVVLVHGARADSSSWDGVITRLWSLRYHVVAPPNPLRGVRSDAAYLADYLKTVKGPIVLVGHS
ncbi:alpha/beta fold hydrolase [Streptomyces sp. NPDC002763]|uniref:alpha/beta fold hydrolase n=1 Tax=Streptomyces sp. NPDC002763 TaxID=3154427 RepID=UPI003327ED3B